MRWKTEDRKNKAEGRREARIEVRRREKDEREEITE
jgi:hypothetical protein